MGMDFERHASDLHLQVFGASEGPVGRAIRAFHFETRAGGNACRDFVCQVFSDGDDLRAGVDDACLQRMAAD
jgi:hypothetical protein